MAYGYGANPWALTSQGKNKRPDPQTKLERSISPSGNITNGTDIARGQPMRRQEPDEY